MARITEINLKNFKFFGDVQSISVDSKHVLIYGENGSGKSSIYWALYTLLECANKPSLAEIEKYFRPNDAINQDSLLNVHAPVGESSHITIQLDDDTAFSVSNTDSTINADYDAQASNFASDFINYRFLYKTHDFRHSQEIDLFPLFRDQLFPYVKFGPVSYREEGQEDTPLITENAGKIYELVMKGPIKIPSPRNPAIPKSVYPTAKKQSERVRYDLKISGFKAGLEALLRAMNERGNKILKEDLDYDIRYSLSLDVIDPIIKSNLFTPPSYKIRLNIVSYCGQTNVVNRPQSFLNEAKLSAIALSMRLAVLQERIDADNAKLKVLVLDDMLISLDMSNRQKALDLIFGKYIDDYQLFILTHDRAFFNLVQSHIDRYHQKKPDSWMQYEMYAIGDQIDDESAETDHPRPLLIPSRDAYASAMYHLRKGEYPPAANYFRKETEHMFEKYFPREVNVDSEGNNYKTLRTVIKQAIDLLARLHQPTDLLDQLVDYLNLLLNPLSHKVSDTNAYKADLFAVKALLPKIKVMIQALKVKEIIARENLVELFFEQNTTTTQVYQIRTKQPLYTYQQDGNWLISDCEVCSETSYTITEGVGGEKVKNEHYKCATLEAVYHQVCTFKNVAPVADYLPFYKNNVGVTFAELCNDI